MSEKLAGGELDRSSAVAKPSTDWSCTTRKSLALLKSSADPAQSKITSFFEVVDKVVALVEESSTISEMMQALQDRRGFERHANRFSPLFRQLMLNAEKNLEELPKQRRHQELLKKFSISLFIVALLHTTSFKATCPKLFPAYEPSSEMYQTITVLFMKVNLDLKNLWNI